MMHRIRMSLDAALNAGSGGSAFTDTGPNVYGRLMQMRWDPALADTGADLALEQMMEANADTGNSYQFYNDNDVLGTQFVKCVRQATHNASGNAIDTGDDFSEPIYFAGEPIRMRVTPGDTGHIEGVLHLWIEAGHN